MSTFERRKSGLIVSRRGLLRRAGGIVAAPAILKFDRALAQVGPLPGMGPLSASRTCVGGNDSNTKLLLHCNEGALGGSTFLDASSIGNTVTAHGGVTTSATQYKFGPTAALFNGSSGYLSCASNSNWALSGAFTVDLWVNFSSLSGISSFINTVSSGGFALYYSSGSLQIARDQVGSDLSVSYTFSTGQWYHVAAVRSSGNTEYLFVNGSLLGSGSYSTSYAQSGLIIGSDQSGPVYMSGYIDEFRWTNGVARWTANFTPPGGPYC